VRHWMAAVLGAAVVLLAVGGTSVGAAELQYGTRLRGAAVVTNSGEPNQGDPDGKANSHVTLDPATGDVCFGANVVGTSEPTAATVHVGHAGTNGPPVFDLPTPPLGPALPQCTTVDPALLTPIVANPTHYYVLLTTDEYPAGALRAQMVLGGGGLCRLVAEHPEGRPGVNEPTSNLELDELEATTVYGFFAADAELLVSVRHDGVLVSSEVVTPPRDTQVVSRSKFVLEFEFANGYDGIWTVTAEDPAVGDCLATATITVKNAWADGGSDCCSGGATTPGPPPAAATPVLPNTAMPSGDGRIGVIGAGLTAAALIVSRLARRRLTGRSHGGATCSG
jgi:hypothetical protein